MQYTKISKLKQGDREYEILKNKGNANTLYLHFLEQILNESGWGAYSSNYNNSDSAIDKNEHGIICVDKQTKELTGFLLSRSIGNFRENEIMIVCSPEVEVIRKMLIKHTKWATQDRLNNVVTFVPDNKNLTDIYESCGFVVVDRLKRRFPTEFDVVKMMYYME